MGSSPFPTTFEQGALRGVVRLPGDKSISHRALMLAAIAPGTSTLRGLNEGADVAATYDALVALGAAFTRIGDALAAHGAELHDPNAPIDARNSGTTARLLLGLCSGMGITAAFDGDASLRSRPMERAAGPLRAMGAEVETTRGMLPVHVRGIAAPPGGTFALAVASAQIKSAILLAHLHATGVVRITGDRDTRDHTERMLRAFGRHIDWDGATIELHPGSLQATTVAVPGDLSAAAFFAVAASIVPDSEVFIEGVGINPTRSGCLDALRAMGAAIAVHNERESGGEPIADLHVVYRPLRATTIAANVTVRAIDEIPVLAIAAAYAHGTTHIRDAAELRVKESDRLTAVSHLLRACGVPVTERPDGLDIEGGGALHPPAQAVTTLADHRIAMSAAVLAARCGPVTIDDAQCVAVSYPAFSTDWVRLQKAPS